MLLEINIAGTSPRKSYSWKKAARNLLAATSIDDLKDSTRSQTCQSYAERYLGMRRPPSRVLLSKVTIGRVQRQLLGPCATKSIEVLRSAAEQKATGKEAIGAL
jgi:hypothetical protein